MTFGLAPRTPSGAITLRVEEKDGVRRFYADGVEPEAAFSRQLLEQADGRYLIIDQDAQTITLAVDNGTWIWRIIGANDDHSVCYGRWPD